MTLLRRLALEAALGWVRSLRPRFVESPPLPDSGILVLWHEHMLPCLAAFQKRNMRVLISASRDGEFGARAAERLGYRTVRGSTSRSGAAALRALAGALQREGGWVAIVADGPRGPRREAKPGAAWLARRTGLPVFGATADCPIGFTLNSWDRCRIPLPFSRVRLRVARVEPGEFLSLRF
jgi:lysophospholipid acyltransferase (LPLAT)-like uncharacterized protein